MRMPLRCGMARQVSIRVRKGGDRGAPPRQRAAQRLVAWCCCEETSGAAERQIVSRLGASNSIARSGVRFGVVVRMVTRLQQRD